jgi:hypothetical protein
MLFRQKGLLALFVGWRSTQTRFLLLATTSMCNCVALALALAGRHSQLLELLLLLLLLVALRHAPLVAVLYKTCGNDSGQAEQPHQAIHLCM